MFCRKADFFKTCLKKAVAIKRAKNTKRAPEKDSPFCVFAVLFRCHSTFFSEKSLWGCRVGDSPLKNGVMVQRSSQGQVEVENSLTGKLMRENMAQGSSSLFLGQTLSGTAYSLAETTS